MDVLKQKDKVRKQLGYLPQEFGVYSKLSTEDSKVLVSISTNASGTGEIKYIVSPSNIKRNILKIYAKYETGLGNPTMIRSTFNLTIENK